MSKNTNIKVVTGLVRFANVHLYKPVSWVEGESPKYSVTLIIPKSDTKTIESINSAFAQVLELNKSKLTNKLKIPYGLKDGDTERGDPLYSDAYFINASTSEKPGIVDVDLNPLIEPNDVYDGCHGRVSITFFAYSVNGKGGIGVGLNNIQKLKDSEPNQKPISDFADGGSESDRAGLIGLIKAEFKLDWDGIHGANHWARVFNHGKNIGQIRQADLLVVELFGLLHDSCRFDDGRDPKHGERAAEFAHGIHGDFYQLNPKQLDALCYAMKHHSGGEVSTNKTIQTCWDADRLDLGRVGIFPSPEFLSQEASLFIDLAYSWSTQAPRKPHVR